MLSLVKDGVELTDAEIMLTLEACLRLTQLEDLLDQAAKTKGSKKDMSLYRGL